MNTAIRNNALKKLQNTIGYSFRQPEILKQAMTHRSFSAQNNERLEFIGDSILNYVVAKMLFDAFADLSEGRLSRLRANLVNQEVLAEIARELHLGDALFLGQGELKSGGFDRPSILADALEALFAAVSLDADFTHAERIVRQLFQKRIAEIDLTAHAKDAKTLLQEALQGLRLSLPKYRIMKQSEKDSGQVFEIECDLGELGKKFYATANSRRAAEQIAAQAACNFIREQYGEIK
ncbi:MAG: ribonuclease III [Neisseriaceae bacterium]|nr:ribonuclease III [Neisseriaceae bacterium]